MRSIAPLVVCTALTGAHAAPVETFGGELAVGDSIAGLSVDVNADGFFDINFAYFGITVNSIFAWDGVFRAADGIPDARFAAALDANDRLVHPRFDAGDTIGPAQILGAEFGAVAYEEFFSGISGGPWLDQEQGYAGFSFLIDGERHYGYAELAIDNSKNTDDGFLVLYRIAYETDPDTPIVAGEPSSCPADLADPFGTLNFFDIAAYIALFNAADPAADLAPPSGVLNFFDLAEYITLYNAGCP